MKSNHSNETIQIKTTQQYFPAVPSIMLYKVVLPFDSVENSLKCDHSNESSRAVQSSGAVHYAHKATSTF